MKKFLILFNCVLISFSISSQSRIEFCKYLLSQTDITLQWTINGLTFIPSDSEVVIYPHDQGIDTIYFKQTRLTKTKYDTIYSKIPNNTSLVMKIGCSDDMFDIVTKEDYEERVLLFETNPSLDFDSLDMSLLQYGSIKFEILNKPNTDTLICAYAGSLYISQMITIQKDYEWVIPRKTGYKDNIIDIYIIKLNESIHFETIKSDKNKHTKGVDIVQWYVDKWPLEPEIILKKFGLRLFNNEKVIIQYDYLTNELFIKFD